MDMPEEPPIEARQSDGRKGKFGPVIYRLGVVINTVAWAIGVAPSKVVAGLFFLGFLMFTGMLGAVYWAARGAKLPDADVDRNAFHAAPPTPGKLNRVKKQDTTGFVGYGVTPPSAGSPSGSQNVFFQSPDSGYGGVSAFQGSDQQDPITPPSKPRRVQKPWPDAKGRGLRKPEWKSGDTAQTSGNRSGGGSGYSGGSGQGTKGGRFNGMIDAADAAGGGLPGVPTVGAGRDVMPGPPDRRQVGRSNNEKIAGPVKQSEIPDTGPGKEAAPGDGRRPPSTGGSTGQRFETAAPAAVSPGEELKIELNTSIANDVDKAYGIQVGD